MLQRLTIRDFVLVDQLELDFQSGFSVLTGETGAGKSILIDALAAVLGERTDAGVIRSGRERAEISAEFSLAQLPETRAWLAEHDLIDEDVLILRRVIDVGGRSRAYLNGSPTTAQQLREVAERLIDLHGQHAHQSLLRSDVQRQLLDAHGSHLDLVQQTGEAWQTWRLARERLEQADRAADQALRQRDELQWQIDDLQALATSPGEWETLNQEHSRLAHAAHLLEGAQQALAAVSGNVESRLSPGALRLDTAALRLTQLSEFDPALRDVALLIQSAHAELSEAGSVLHRYIDRIDLDPAQLSEIETRLAALLACARKYRTTPESLPALLEQSRAQLEALTSACDLEILGECVLQAEADYRQLADRLSSARRQAATQLSQAVSELIQQLALGSGRFEAVLTPAAAGVHGNEQVEFRIAGLAQQEARPLAKVASGGELSRISLAIQVVTSRAACIPTLIFDEVDSGIGGSVAEVVGRLLYSLGRERQVLCVTHLAQVAARAEQQWQVSKTLDDGQPRSRVVLLDEPGRVEEIARMLGGMEITKLTRQHAAEMLTGLNDAS